MSDKIYIGQLNYRITLNSVQLVASETGEEKRTEVPFKTVWAKVDDVTGSETDDGKIIALNVRKYVVRYQKDILLNAVKLVIVDVDGTYNVNSVNQLGFKEYLVLKCSKRE